MGRARLLTTSAGHRDGLLPEALRKRFSRLVAQIDFVVSTKDLRAFRAAWVKSGGTDPKAWGPFTARNDVCLALGLQKCKKTASGIAFHARVEYRRGAKSPYDRVSQRQMAMLTACLRELARDASVAFWSQETTIARKAAADSGFGGLLDAEPREGPDGYRMRLCGLSATFEKDARSVALSLSWNDENLTATEWGQDLARGTFDELFDPEKPVLVMPHFPGKHSGKESDDAPPSK